MKKSFKREFVMVWILAGLLCFAAGCATQGKQKNPYIFFPTPPDEPRLQFLTSFSSERELGGRSSFVDFVVGKDTQGKPVVKPYGLTLGKGKIYICDTELAAVDIVDLVKGKIRYFQPIGEATLGQPVNIAVDADGTRYVTDTKRNQVLIFSDKDVYLGAIGNKDEMIPTGVAVNAGRIYVVDKKNHCVRVYNKADRKELFTIPRDPNNPVSPQARLYQPTNIALNQKGQVYVSDTGDFSVKAYDADGAFVRFIGGQGLAPGLFGLNKGVALDREGRLYVVDARTELIQIFDPEGHVLMDFGEPASANGGSTGLPAGVAVDYDNVKYFQQYAAPGFKVEYLVLVVNQVGTRKISIFGFGHKN